MARRVTVSVQPYWRSLLGQSKSEPTLTALGKDHIPTYDGAYIVLAVQESQAYLGIPHTLDLDLDLKVRDAGNRW